MTDPTICVCPSPSWAVLLAVLLAASVLAAYLRARTRRLVLVGLATAPRTRVVVALLDVTVTLGVGVGVGLLGHAASSTSAGLCVLAGATGAALAWLPGLVRRRADGLVDRFTGEHTAARPPER